MSKYTTELRYICEHDAGLTESVGLDGIGNVIAQSRQSIFGTDYPIFDENYRATLETKILKHYYFREIGLETAALFKHFLRTRMGEIMPYYNQLYRSETLEFNPLYDFTYTRDFTRDNREAKEATRVDANTRTDNTQVNTTTDSTRTDNTNTANTGNIVDEGWDTVLAKNINRYSDTPQGGIDGIDPIDAQNRYLTNVTIDEDNDHTTRYNKRDLNTNTANTGTVENEGSATTTNTGTVKFDTTTTDTHSINDLTNYIEHVSGKRGGQTYAKMMMEYRKSMLNIDTMIINELSDLFMGIY